MLLVYKELLITIVDVAAPPSTTLNLILLAVVGDHPVTRPVVSVSFAAGTLTLTTFPTGFEVPEVKAIKVGVVAGSKIIVLEIFLIITQIQIHGL